MHIKEINKIKDALVNRMADRAPIVFTWLV
ncbi:hypothetical protein SAMN05421820_11685 [Pedobacter steynii]|uniref:Uncharacterized protein n=1 Tax=Pedobacter steynii TaxID=430522 RepID=A0A1H0KKT3_9SPHI|nr:hypothetical protein SAMN05421820_11685 [Pedobacter steynii]